MKKYGNVALVRQSLQLALNEISTALGVGQGSQAVPPPPQPVPSPPGRARSHQGSRPGSGLGGSPHLVTVKVGLEDALRKLETYDSLPGGQLALLGARRNGLEQVKQAIATLVTQAKTFQLPQKVLPYLTSALKEVTVAFGMLDQLYNMYVGGGNDPDYHWRLLSGLIGGYSASFEQTATPRIADQVWTQGLTPIRIMEALTPNHNFVEAWELRIGEWLAEVRNGTTQEPFLLWYESRQELGTGTNYFGDAARHAALVTLAGGKLFQLAPVGDGKTSTLQPLTTAAYHSSGDVHDMFMAYCLDEFGVLYVYPHKESAGAGLVDLAMKRMDLVAGEQVSRAGHMFHSSGHRGQPVAGAGMIQVVDGLVIGISTKSGHYWPSVQMFLQTLEFLGQAAANAIAYFDFYWKGEMCVASCPARDFLRIGKAGFPPSDVAEIFMFGPMHKQTGALQSNAKGSDEYDLEGTGVFDGQDLKACAEYFLATYSHYSMNETRRILEERRLAQRTRLGIYRGRTLDAVLFREWERERMMKQIGQEEDNGFVSGPTPFDQTPLDSGAAARHQANIEAAQQGRPPSRQRSNNFKRYQ
jgi:hypothetical protein